MKYLLIFLLVTKVFANEGKRLYFQKCTKCHNRNPEKAGSIGPDLANSSFELLKAKTQYRKYPDGYKPKRKTNAMPRIALADEKILYIEAFLRKP